MNDVAIDFRKLMKEEKKRARQKLQQQQRKPQTAATTAASIVAESAAATNYETPKDEEKKFNYIMGEASEIENTGAKTQNYVTVRDEDVEAIDFELLRQEEQAKAAQKEQERIMADGWFIPSNIQLCLNVMSDTTKTRQYLLCQNPASIYYIPEFLPRSEDQKALLDWLQKLPENSHSQSSSQKSTEKDANGAWTEMKFAKRRVALFDSSALNHNLRNATNETTRNNSPMLFASYPVLQRFADALVSQGIFSSEHPPNHVLVNEYHPGQGIMAHTDGPAYFSRTATLSLGSDVLISFTKRPKYDENETKIIMDKTKIKSPDREHICLLQKGSLLVFEDSAYLDYCHGIKDRIFLEHITDQCLNATIDYKVGTCITRGYRISLTFRHKYNKSAAWILLNLLLARYCSWL